MEQLEFEFVRKRYDIFSDSIIPVNSLAVGAVYWAYGKIREARNCSAGNVSVTVLDSIHEALKARLNEPA